MMNLGKMRIGVYELALPMPMEVRLSSRRARPRFVPVVEPGVIGGRKEAQVLMAASI